MKKQYLVDTSLIVDYLRENKKSASFLNSLNKVIISTITVAEIYQGAKNKKDLKSIKKLFKFFKILPIDEKISQLSLKLLEKYTLSNGLLILNSIIAATAMQNNLTLITGNFKHFKMIKGLKVEKW